MIEFEIIVVLLLGGAALAALARRIGAPYPALVALAGALLALLPGLPTVELDPELALTLFVAPVLMDAAFDASPRDLRANWRPVASLALGAVVLTVAVVACVARLLVPDIPWAAAIALGAIVAPPDAAAATAVLRQLRPPYRLMVILEGESLFNDAIALLIYRIAVGATVTGFIAGWRVLPLLVLVTAGSLAFGVLFARLLIRLYSRISDVATSIVVQFCGAFAVWVIAERIGLSGILTTVVFAMTVARRAGEVTPARIRIPSYAVWEFAVFVLNVLAFILVGLQLKPIIARLEWMERIDYARIAAFVCLATILARIAWVTAAAAYSRWRVRSRDDKIPSGADTATLSSRAAAVVGWCGMRGTVTLAAALALPMGRDGAPPFPNRDLILFTAFSVVLGTLVLQGLTLKPLLARLQLRDDGAVEREIRIARVETLKAALRVANETSGIGTADIVRQRYALQLHRAEVDLAASDGDGAAARQALTDTRRDEFAVVRQISDAERQRLLALRSDGTIGDAAFQRVEQELDFAELDIEQLLGVEAER